MNLDKELSDKNKVQDLEYDEQIKQALMMQQPQSQQQPTRATYSTNMKSGMDAPGGSDQMNGNGTSSSQDPSSDPQHQSQVWIPSAIGAALFFCITNEVISIVTDHVDGMACVFYLSFGAWVTGMIFQVVMCIKNWRNPEVDYIWHKHNLIIDGKLKITHLLLFLIMCCLYFGIMSSIFMTMYFSHMSGVNVGVITTIWSVQPLIAAVIDYIVYREVLGFHHFMGIVLVIAGAACIGCAGLAKGPPEVNNQDGHFAVYTQFDPKAPAWLAILWGFITPCMFLAQSFYTKFITQPKYGFCPKTAVYGTSSITSFIVLVVGVAWFWNGVQPFDRYLFLVGIVASAMDTVGKSFIQTAFSKGPAGPVAAFVEMNNILLVVFDGLRTWHMPAALEIVGFIFGITGGLIFIFPEEMKKFKRCLLASFCCCCYEPPIDSVTSGNASSGEELHDRKSQTGSVASMNYFTKD